MEIRVIDFEILTSHYKNYRDGVDKINAEKEAILKKIEPIKKEMNQIISSVQSGLIMDARTQQQKGERFQELQKEVMQIDNDFKYKNRQMVDELNTKSYDELSNIISVWAVKNSIDLVSGKMEIVFCNDKWDITNDILEVLKEQNLYVDRPIEKAESETEKESV